MKRWHFPKYDFSIHLIHSVKEIKNERARITMAKDLIGGCAGACHYDRRERICYLLIDPAGSEDFPDLVDTIVHEVTHAVGWMYRKIGDETRIRHVPETLAYYQGYMAGEVIRALGYE